MLLVKFGMQAGKSTGGGAETGNFENLSKLREKAFAVQNENHQGSPFSQQMELMWNKQARKLQNHHTK